MSLFRNIFGVTTVKPPEVAFVVEHGGRVVVGIEQEMELEALNGDHDNREIIEISYDNKRLLKQRLISVSEASRKYKRSKNRLRKLCKSGKIVCDKSAGKWMIAEDSLASYLRAS